MNVITSCVSYILLFSLYFMGGVIERGVHIIILYNTQGIVNKHINKLFMPNYAVCVIILILDTQYQR